MKLKIVNKKKFMRTMSIICFGITILMGCQKIYSTGEVNYKESYVLAGDTLWSIATEEASENEYYKDMDIRDIIKDIRKINHLKNADIYNGQQLRIPIL